MSDKEPKWSNFIGEYLYELFKNQCLCDVKLQVGNVSFLVHKLVLAAFSDVFCPASPNIRPAVCVDVPDTTPDALYQVLQYLYTSEMELCDDTLDPVLNAAVFMGITDIVDMIKEILGNPTMENVDMYMRTRQRIGMSANLLDFIELARDHFLELTDHEAFLCMDSSSFIKLLEDPKVLVESEMDTLNAVIKWLEFNPLQRIKYTGAMLKKINLDCIEPPDLVRVIESKRYLFEQPDAQVILVEAFKKLALKSDDPPCCIISQPPCCKEKEDNTAIQCQWTTNSSACLNVGASNNQAIDNERKTFRQIRKSFATKRRNASEGRDGEETLDDFLEMNSSSHQQRGYVSSEHQDTGQSSHKQYHGGTLDRPDRFARGHRSKTSPSSPTRAPGGSDSWDNVSNTGSLPVNPCRDSENTSGYHKKDGSKQSPRKKYIELEKNKHNSHEYGGFQDSRTQDGQWTCDINQRLKTMKSNPERFWEGSSAYKAQSHISTRDNSDGYIRYSLTSHQPAEPDTQTRGSSPKCHMTTNANCLDKKLRDLWNTSCNSSALSDTQQQSRPQQGFDLHLGFSIPFLNSLSNK